MTDIYAEVAEALLTKVHGPPPAPWYHDLAGVAMLFGWLLVAPFEVFLPVPHLYR